MVKAPTVRGFDENNFDDGDSLTFYVIVLWTWWLAGADDDQERIRGCG